MIVATHAEDLSLARAGAPQAAQITQSGRFVANLAKKEPMLSLDQQKFFTEPHYNGFPAVLVRLENLPRRTEAQLKSALALSGSARANLSETSQLQLETLLAGREPDLAVLNHAMKLHGAFRQRRQPG